MKGAANNARVSVASQKLQANLGGLKASTIDNSIDKNLCLEQTPLTPKGDAEALASPTFPVSDFHTAPGSPIPLLKSNSPLSIEKKVTTTIEADAIQEAHRRIDLSWSEPFLRTALVIVRNSRRALTSHLKTLELRNREIANDELKGFINDSQDSAERMLSIVANSGLV